MSLRLAVLGFLALAAPVTARAFHNHLERSLPAADSTVSSPAGIRLWFAEPVEPKFSSLNLLTADSTKVEIGKAHATDDPKSFAADVPATLAPGKYIVAWRTAGDDGHAVRGKFAFTVR